MSAADEAPHAQQEAISDAVSDGYCQNISVRLYRTVYAFSICSNSPSLICLTAWETIRSNVNSLFSTERSRLRESK
jgi:hypothetical protein